MRWIVLFLILSTSAKGQYDAVLRKLEALVISERESKQIPNITIALVDDQKLVWQHTSGEGGPQSIYRAGSVSNLFTAIAIMQQVEKGKLDLDAPVTTYLRDFSPSNPYDKPITLRLLLCHRSGLVREPPVGHYFDNTTPAPSLPGTVRSLNDTQLVYEPGRHTKYSDAGIATAGRILEAATGNPFAAHLRRFVLDPLGMSRSDFRPRPDLLPHLAKAFLWTYDGRTLPAPNFELGMTPASSLYATTGDLGKFLSALFRNGEPILQPATLSKMWEPQLGGTYGLGFALDRVDGIRAVSHGGAIYGFATDLRAIPTEKLGAIVIANVDSSNSVAARIATQALHWMRAARRGEPLDDVPPTEPIPAEETLKLEGVYGEGDQALELQVFNGTLYLTPARGGTRLQLRRSGEEIVTDDRLGAGLRFIPQTEGLQSGANLLRRQPPATPAPCPSELSPYLGEYGWDHNMLYVLERAGKLTVLIEWHHYYPLTAVSPGVYQFPDWGLYDGELLTFSSEGARVGGVLFPRRTNLQSAIFRITPQKPVADLRKAALEAQPPAEAGPFRPSELTELKSIDRTIRLDIRYASRDNFLSTPVYSQARAFLQKPAAEALVRAHHELNKLGYGLLIHDAYRPWYVTHIFWNATPEDKHIFVADPSKGSRHNRGCAVDLTIYDLKTDKPVEMPGLYDEMSERSFPGYPGSTSMARYYRELLRRTMEKQGFRVFEFEWWHFDFKGWEQYGIGNTDFEGLRKIRGR